MAVSVHRTLMVPSPGGLLKKEVLADIIALHNEERIVEFVSNFISFNGKVKTFCHIKILRHCIKQLV